ncbi:MAG: hypothetical protein KF721_09740 [Ignavibacteriaceae bacterium]|nr:hypothetical protein [Ignavibacteriaceae bacterium]
MLSKQIILFLFFILSLSFNYSQNIDDGNELQKLLNEYYEYTFSYDDIPAYNLDVMQYYNLEKEYSTPLKQKKFKESPEYSEKLKDLKEIKNELLSKKYYVKITKPFKEYDLSQKGFMSFIKENMGQGTMKARPPKEISKILFPSLPFKYVTKKTLFDNKIYHPDIKEEFIFLNVPEKTAVEIEDELKSIEIYLLFNIGGKENVNYKYYCTTYGWYDIKKELLVAKNVHLVIANSNTGKIFYSKKH